MYGKYLGIPKHQFHQVMEVEGSSSKANGRSLAVINPESRKRGEWNSR